MIAKILMRMVLELYEREAKASYKYVSALSHVSHVKKKKKK